MKNVLTLCVLLLLSLVACKKEEKEKEVIPADNFQPVSPFSTWTYSGFPDIEVYSVTMTGMQALYNEHICYESYSTQGKTCWYRKANGSYYYLIPAGDTVQEYLYLRDNSSVGARWTDEYEVNGYDTRYDYTIIEMNNSKLVYGNIYPSVITVKRETWVDFGMGTDSLVADEKFSYANNVGLIMIDKGKQVIYLSDHLIQ